jgi:hypothetical protein
MLLGDTRQSGTISLLAIPRQSHVNAVCGILSARALQERLITAIHKCCRKAAFVVSCEGHVGDLRSGHSVNLDRRQPSPIITFEFRNKIATSTEEMSYRRSRSNWKDHKLPLLWNETTKVIGRVGRRAIFGIRLRLRPTPSEPWLLLAC